MRSHFAIQLATFFCLFTAILAFACMTPDIAGYAGVRLRRLCLYNGTCSRAIGASVLIYRQGEGADVYFQSCDEMSENEATYLGGNQTFGFGKNFHPSRTWVCLPFWFVVFLWLVQVWRSQRIRHNLDDVTHVWWRAPILAALASSVMFLWAPMHPITVTTWSTVILACSWCIAAIRRIRQRNQKLAK